MPFGTRKCKQFVPVHKRLIQLGPQLCPNILKCHVLTKIGSTSKVGTKSVALKSDLNKFLQNFGSDD